jgi:predicted phosphodiesterase
MRLQVLSDLHLEFGDFQPEHTDADVVILAGDIHIGRKGIKWAQKCFPDKPVIYVMGNHEFYGHSMAMLIKDVGMISEGTNICLLENQSVEIGGFTFLGCSLWTDFSLGNNPSAAMLAAGNNLTDYYRIKRGGRLFQPEDSLKLHQESLQWLRIQLANNDSKKTVVITHHAPSEKSIPTKHIGSILNGAFASNLTEFTKQSQVPLWIHGHTHYSVDYRIGRTRVFSNQRGYPHEPDPGFKSGCLLEL